MSRNSKNPQKEQIMDSIRSCTSIGELFEIVRKEQIDIRMQTLCSASSVPAKDLTFLSDEDTSPLDRLKAAVLLAAQLHL